MICIVQAVEVFATGLVAGIFAMSAFGVLPAAAKLDTSAHILMRQHLGRPLSKIHAAFDADSDRGVHRRGDNLSHVGVVSA